MPLPTADECAARHSIAVADRAMFDAMYAAAVADQQTACAFDYDPDDPRLGEALQRRVANLWASKAHTLGVLDTGLDLGVAYVPRYDPMVDALERHAREIAVG